ncbi:MAG: 23S rRNA (adenine(2503)-C(2))-methyltransferase RlmN [Alloprevotella sp.]
MQPLIGLTLDELKGLAASLGLPAFRARQMAHWLYGRHVRHIEEMTDLPRQVRQLLAERCEVGYRPPLRTLRSADGTVKYLFPTAGGRYVESVFIPADGDRATLCVSCQVGCKMGCSFCMTGRQGFEASLSAADILGQIYALPERERLTNVVFMGQGEPFDNLDNVLKATEILTAEWGYAWSPKRITVSSVGLRKGLLRFLQESRCHLAISLHNPLPEERARLMPAEKAMSIVEVVDALKATGQFARRRGTPEAQAGQRRLTFEYIVLEGLNDSRRHADALLRLLEGLDCRVNLIRFHTIPDSPYRGASEARMTELRDYLTRRGLFTTIRASRGEDIMAACGLLTTAEKERKAQQHA